MSGSAKPSRRRLLGVDEAPFLAEARPSPGSSSRTPPTAPRRASGTRGEVVRAGRSRGASPSLRQVAANLVSNLPPAVGLIGRRRLHPAAEPAAAGEGAGPPPRAAPEAARAAPHSSPRSPRPDRGRRLRARRRCGRSRRRRPLAATSSCSRSCDCQGAQASNAIPATAAASRPTGGRSRLTPGAARTRTSNRDPAPTRRGSGRHPADDLARDVEPEAGPPTPRERFGSSRKNFSKIRSCSEVGMPSPRSRTANRTLPSSAPARLDAAAFRGVLDRVLDEVDEHLAEPVRVGGDLRPPLGRSAPSSISAGRCASAAASTPRASSAASVRTTRPSRRPNRGGSRAGCR